MRKIALLLATTSLLYSYQKGDQVDTSLLQHLGVESDKTYVVDFFASWCESCKKEIPLISKANSKIDQTKAKIIGVDVDEDINKAQDFQKELKQNNALNFDVVNDPSNMIIKAFDPIAMPALFYIKEGKVQKVIYGAVDKIDTIIQQDLKAME
ncbi:MAG: TlpA family protein disulfide reductase [Epsilonproteobacteria bacterium]|nr:TlpA family protein disulfide reductase [Campylobacterota bacterium]